MNLTKEQREIIVEGLTVAIDALESLSLQSNVKQSAIERFKRVRALMKKDELGEEAMRVDLDGSKHNKGHVFVYDPEGRLRFKMWFYGDGVITWREFDEEGLQTHPRGEQHWRVITCDL